MPAEDWFTDLIRAYGEAWDAGDVEAVCAAYHTPCLVVGRERIAILTDEAQKRAHFAPRLQSPTELGYERTEVPACEVTSMGERNALARVNWRCLTAAGEVVYDFWHSYHLTDIGNGWKLLTDTTHE